jgi:hypothetical protein
VADITALQPADVVVQLRTLLTVVVSLFAVMQLGAALAFTLDAAARRAALARLTQPDAGFRIAGDGCWLWRFTLAPLRADVDAPRGSAVTLSSILGIPFARLRAAMPDELLCEPGLGAALGRRRAFSRAAMAQPSSCMLLPRKATGGPRSTNKVAPAAHGNGDGNGDASTDDDDDGAPSSPKVAVTPEQELLEELVGTALVLAFLQVAALLPVVQLAALRASAARHFEGAATPSGLDFSALHTALLTLVSPGVLTARHRWLPRARAWKLILSQNAEEGWWDASSTTAFACEARAAAEAAAVRPTLLQRTADALGGCARAAAARGDADALADACFGGPDNGSGATTPLASGGGACEFSTPPDSGSGSSDCPLTCSAAAIAASLPARLARAHGGDTDATRVWTTLCVIAVLERSPVCWLWGDGELYPSRERTIVDAAREWVKTYAAARPALAAALADGALQRRARRVTTLWHRACEERVAELRRSEPIRAQMHASHIRRTCTELARAVITQHSTFRVFLSEPLDGLQRWQSAMCPRIMRAHAHACLRRQRCLHLAVPATRLCVLTRSAGVLSFTVFMILISVILTQLLVNIWRARVRRNFAPASHRMFSMLHVHGDLNHARRPGVVAAQDVLRQKRELLRGRARRVERRARRRDVPSTRHQRCGRRLVVPRHLRQLRRHPRAICRRAGAAGLPRRHGGAWRARAGGPRSETAARLCVLVVTHAPPIAPSAGLRVPRLPGR